MKQSIYFYKTNGAHQRINLDEVLALETARNYVKFYTPDGMHLVRTSLEMALNQLQDRGFVQIHRCYAVAIDKLYTIDKENVYFSASSEDKLPIAKSFYTNLIRQLKMIGEEGEHDQQQEIAAK